MNGTVARPTLKEVTLGPAESQHRPIVQTRNRLRIHPLVWILLGGAIVRVALWFAWTNWSPLINDDARDYEQLAVRMLTTGTYSSEKGTPISLRPPGYPTMVAATYAGFGLENNDAVRAIQSVIGLAIVFIVYRIAAIVYSRRVVALGGPARLLLSFAARLCQFTAQRNAVHFFRRSIYMVRL